MSTVTKYLHNIRKIKRFDMMLVDMGSLLQLIVVAMHLKDNFEKS